MTSSPHQKAINQETSACALGRVGPFQERSRSPDGPAGLGDPGTGPSSLAASIDGGLLPDRVLVRDYTAACVGTFTFTGLLQNLQTRFCPGEQRQDTTQTSFSFFSPAVPPPPPFLT